MSETKTNAKLKAAVAALHKGELVVFPTDTAYGIGGDFENPGVIQKILEVKGRIDRKFILIAGSIDQVKHYFGLSERAERLAEKFWPGPLSIVVSDQFAIRVPDQPLARQLAEAFGKPIIATSANRSGQSDLYEIDRVRADLDDSAAAVWLDGGELPRRLPSTVIRVVNGGELELIREGAIPFAEVTAVA